MLPAAEPEPDEPGDDVVPPEFGDTSSDQRNPTQPADDALFAAIGDLHDDLFRTGRRLRLTDIQRTAARHRLSPRDTARLEIRMEKEGVLDLRVESDFSLPPARVKSRGDALDAWFEAASQYRLLTPEEEIELAREYEAGRLASEEIERDQPNSEPLRRKLIETIDRGERARSVLISSNLRLVASIVTTFYPQGMDRVDLMQEGVLGLIHAIEKFDWRLGFKLSTYATWWIRQATQRSLDMNGRLIRLPVHVHEKIRGIRREARRMQSRLGREPTLKELSESIGMDPAQIAFLRALDDVVSLDQKLAGEPEDAELVDVLAADQESVEEIVERDLQSQELMKLIAQLDDRERTILMLRFGLEDDRPLTLEDIGNRFGLTRERIRQIETKALAHIRWLSSMRLAENQ